ncbi:MAG: hypothetical protein KF901_03710 [Myxococcales bacterium]|nr:hypothetical protein [Myxococcales bacterium]
MLRRSLLSTFALFALVLSCGGGTRYVVQQGGGTVYLLTNLHPDARNVLSSLNYTAPSRGSLLAMCTPVQILRVTDREIRFQDLNTNRRYRYILHRSTRMSTEQHMQRYFGGACSDLLQLSAEDQSGIQRGQVFQGMTKQGVILALGYPPEHQTPTLEADVWRYWSDGRRSFEVHFINGVVNGIR